LAKQLRQDGIEKLWVTGLAEDVCVLATVIDACREGFHVALIKEATQSITPESVEKARQKMQDLGVDVV